MPLVRFGLRNEYGLGQPELYKEANKEDPKAVLDGVAVAGLVGILRQLGDLAEFAAEVFHGLQEQVISTSSRSSKLTVRMQGIEAALPSLEKAVLAQTSHVHFAYTTGSEWHPHIQNERNHFICNDLPRFVMDFYEDCRNPPCFHLLDKFDPGGPGSCLKRYSDPTFFRRVSGSTIEATVYKIQRPKKARKKKKRSSERNGELSRVASISNHSERIHVTAPGMTGQTSSQTTSTGDVTLKSDIGDRSKSFDSRTGSGFIECVFDSASSFPPGEQGSKGSSSMVMQHIDIPDSDLCDELTQMVDDRRCSSSQEQVVPSASCVTWDEKAEIVEPKSHQYDKVEVPEVLSSDFDVDRWDRGTPHRTKVEEMDSLLERRPEEVLSANFDIDTQGGINSHHRKADQMDILFDVESEEVLSANFNVDTHDRDPAILKNIDELDIFPATEDTPIYMSNIYHADEVESEIDNYVDALNTIESESENDLDHHMKREVEQCFSSIGNCRMEDSTYEHMGRSSDQSPSNIEPHTISGVPSTNGFSCNFPYSVPSESSFHEQTPQTSGKLSELAHSSGTEICASVDILDGSKVEPVISDGQKVESAISDPSSSGSKISYILDQSSDRIKKGFSETQQSHDELSSVPSVNIWTNGGLLGLEPSKPPDFAVSNASSLKEVVSSKSAPPNTSPKFDGLNGNLESLVENDKSHEKVSISKFGRIPISLAVETNQDQDSNSTIVFGLGHRFLANGFHNKLSLAHEDNSVPVSSPRNGAFDRGSGHHHEAFQTVSERAFMEQFGCGSPLGSRTSSPPLEHMKISFNPVHGFETSKLKLKVPDGSQCPGSVRDMFPSFQLVPEPAIPPRGHGTDSDSDTFCRSSPYMSDDCASHQSESNSELWESSPGGSNDLELYDALCRMPSFESDLSSLQVEREPKIGMFIDHGFHEVSIEDVAEPSLPSLDLPSFDATKFTLQEQKITDCDPNSVTELQNLEEDSPLPPPPLPPVQWRVSKPLSNVAEDQYYSVSDTLRHELEEKLSVSTLSQQCESAPGDLRLTNKVAIGVSRESKLEIQGKLNGKEVHQNADGKGMVEKEDFLHQIRTKSFSLRPTVTARPAFSSAPSANFKVTAILEKASAIRQAVASDDGEDDNWSDT